MKDYKFYEYYCKPVDTPALTPVLPELAPVKREGVSRGGLYEL